MISSRRLAREWALKILYQKDVGKVPAQEALDTALERLRLEFVQRGSRTASGSATEQICLEVVTADLRDVLDGLTRPMERALATVASRLVQDLAYWQEIRIDRLFREPASVLPINSSRRLLMRHVSEAFGLTESEIAILPGLNPPRMARPQPENTIFQGIDLIDLTSTLAQTSNPGDASVRLLRFAHKIREQLPVKLDEEFRKDGIRFVRDVVQRRTADSDTTTLRNGPLSIYLKEQREAFLLAQTERYRRVSEIVEKQTADWLRTAEFATRLVRGVEAHQKEIDTAISTLSSGWNMERQVAVDRNVLRLGGFEIMFMEGVPAAVSINEAVELAKKYSTAESGRFVNGVLGALTAQFGTNPKEHPAGTKQDGRIADITATYGLDDMPDESDILLDMPDDIEDITTEDITTEDITTEDSTTEDNSIDDNGTED